MVIALCWANGKITWRRKWQPTPVFFPGKPHGQPGGLQSVGSQRVRQDWACTHTHTHTQSLSYPTLWALKFETAMTRLWNMIRALWTSWNFRLIVTKCSSRLKKKRVRLFTSKKYENLKWLCEQNPLNIWYSK